MRRHGRTASTVCGVRPRPVDVLRGCLAAIGMGMFAGCTQAPSELPDPVYPPSPVIAGVSFDFTTLRTGAPGSDNWAITWADDDHQYTTWGDGGGFGGSDTDGRVSLGIARIEGSSTAYRTMNVWGGKDGENPASFPGKSYGIVSIDGSLYLWRSGDASDDSAFKFQELYRSDDHGAHWRPTGVAFGPDDFPEGTGFYALTFLQFGRDYAGTRDGYVYIYAPEIAGREWNVQIPGRIALLRVPRDGLTDRRRYEYFAGLDSLRRPLWTSLLGKRHAVFQDDRNGVMRTSVSHNAGLGRYLLVTQQVSRFRHEDGHIGIYDAPQPWGPWTTALFANAWDVGLQTGRKTVFWNFSNKWLSADGKRFALVYTGPGSDEWGVLDGEFLLRSE